MRIGIGGIFHETNTFGSRAHADEVPERLSKLPHGSFRISSQMLVYEANSSGLRLSERVVPRPAQGEVTIEVQAIALNRGEARRAVHGGFPDGLVPGWDTAGLIREIGPNTKAPPIGTRVVGRALSGAWAQYRKVHVDDLAIVPDGVDTGNAAALVTSGATALAVLTRRGSIFGKRVLITGASGSVGRLAIQLARLAGATVIALVNSPKFADTLTALGAHHVVADLAEAPQVDLVLDSLGGATLVQAMQLLRPGGSVQSFGWTSGESAIFPNLDVLTNCGGALEGFAIGEHRVGTLLESLLPLLERRAIRASVQMRRSWSDLPDTAARILERGFSGKAIVELGHEHL
jgi:NADPH:quinone reductase